MLAADYPFLDVLWTMLIVFLWVMWLWVLFTVFADIFRRDDISGWAKTGWLIFTIVLPFLGVFIYVITQNEGMTKRNMERARRQRRQFDDYVRDTADDGRRSRRSTRRSSSSTAARSVRKNSSRSNGER